MSKKSMGMSGHQAPFRGKTDTWLTPPEIISDLGPFDLDPCCPEGMPWKTANRTIVLPEDGFVAQWKGVVWLNPPYGPDTGKWLSRLADHGSGVALIFAKTETKHFFKQVWNRADAVKFLKGRLHFHRLDGTRAKANAGAPSVLVGYGWEGYLRLASSLLPGKLIQLNPVCPPDKD